MGAEAWYLTAGLVLCVTALAATLIQRLPLSTSLVYLPLGWFLGPYGVAAVRPDIVRDAPLIEQAAQIIILISLFSAGLKLRLPLRSRLWLLSVRLAFVAMAITIALLAASGVWFFGLSWGLAILLAGILAPTDPVLASDVQVEDPFHLRALRFGLTSEAGLNDGTAFPFVTLGLTLLTTRFTTVVAWRWFLLDFCWAVAAGAAAGYAVGSVVGRWVLHLRERHGQAVGLGYFLAPGLIALSYGAGEWLHGYGFLSVFTSALALRRIEMEHTGSGEVPELPLISPDRKNQFQAAVDPHTAPLFLVELLRQFTAQLEQLGEVVVVVLVGALLTPDLLSTRVLLPLLLLFFVARPLATTAGLAGTQLSRTDRNLIAWFGIRGIGSVYYLSYAVSHGLPPEHVPWVAATVLGAVAMSVLMHGVSVTPLMNWYSRQPESRAPLRA